MYKKLIIFLLVVSPIIFSLLIGFPIDRLNQESLSQRCFKVGEFAQFVNCYQNHPRLAGYALFGKISRELSLLYPGFNYLFLIFLVGSLIITPAVVEMILKKRE